MKSYEQLLTDAHKLIGSHAKAKMILARVLEAMSRLESVPRIAADLGMAQCDVRRHIETGRFWDYRTDPFGGVPYDATASPTDRRHAVPWPVYVGVARRSHGWRYLTDAEQVQVRDEILATGHATIERWRGICRVRDEAKYNAADRALRFAEAKVSPATAAKTRAKVEVCEAASRLGDAVQILAGQESLDDFPSGAAQLLKDYARLTTELHRLGLVDFTLDIDAVA